MVYTLFYSRFAANMTPAEEEQYRAELGDLQLRVAREFDGYVDARSFMAEDGERLTVVRFRDEASQLAWAKDAVHAKATMRARTTYYDNYRIVILAPMREHEWRRKDPE